MIATKIKSSKVSNESDSKPDFEQPTPEVVILFGYARWHTGRLRIHAAGRQQLVDSLDQVELMRSLAAG